NLGLRLLPGYEISPATIAHLILGYSYAQFAIKDNGNYGIVNSQFNKNGFQVGLGAITSVFNNVFIRMDLLYTDYSSQNSNGRTTNTPPTLQVYHNDFASLEGNFAIIYK